MLDIQEMSDRFEIQDLVFRYAQLVDARDIDGLRAVFTEDAHIDYSAMGGSVGNVDQTLEFLSGALVPQLFPNTQHLNANIQITVKSDTASGRVMCFNPMEVALPEGGTQTMLLGLWYLDAYRRTADGWKISRREEIKSWVFNSPDFMQL